MTVHVRVADRRARGTNQWTRGEAVELPDRVGHEPPETAMDEKTFQNKLANLMSEINTLPEGERQKLAKLAEQTRERHTKMKKTVSDLQESLDYLRLSIKYLVFELEATRRENHYLRDMISKQDQSGNPGEADLDDNQPI